MYHRLRLKIPEAALPTPPALVRFRIPRPARRRRRRVPKKGDASCFAMRVERRAAVLPAQSHDHINYEPIHMGKSSLKGGM